MEKIKILFVHNELVCGGAEQALYDLVCLMDKSKFDITVVVQVDGGVWEEKFRQAGIRVRSIWDCQRNSKNPLIKLLNARKRKKIQQGLERNGVGLLESIWKDQFDIVVSYSIWWMYDMGFYRNAKTVAYVHGDVATNPGYRKSVQKWLPWKDRYNRIICVSEGSRQSFEKFTDCRTGICVHFNPLNDKNIKQLSNEKIDFQPKGRVICAVGRLAAEKGFERLLHIHRHILDRGVFHTLVIVGDGPEKEKLCNLIKELQIQNSVIMVGYSSNPYPYMKNSDLFVCSSYTEGLPVVAMEALCLGTPIVSSAPSVGEAFGEEYCGIITENDDNSLETGIYKVLSNPEELERLQKGAQKRSTFFEGQRMVKEIEAEFMSILDET